MQQALSLCAHPAGTPTTKLRAALMMFDWLDSGLTSRWTVGDHSAGEAQPYGVCKALEAIETMPRIVGYYLRASPALVGSESITAPSERN